MTYKDDVDLNAKLAALEAFYNCNRPHGAFNGKTPYEMLKRLLVQERNRLVRSGTSQTGYGDLLLHSDGQEYAFETKIFWIARDGDADHLETAMAAAVQDAVNLPSRSGRTRAGLVFAVILPRQGNDPRALFRQARENFLRRDLSLVAWTPDEPETAQLASYGCLLAGKVV